MTNTATTAWYRLGLTKAWGGILDGDTQYFIDYLSDTIKISLHTSSYSPAQDTNEFWNACTNECTGGGYTAGGYTFAAKTLTYTASSNTLAFDNTTDPSWVATASWSSSKPRIAVIYKVGGSAATSPLLAYLTFNADASVASGNTFKITLASPGWGTIIPA